MLTYADVCRRMPGMSLSSMPSMPSLQYVPAYVSIRQRTSAYEQESSIPSMRLASSCLICLVERVHSWISLILLGILGILYLVSSLHSCISSVLFVCVLSTSSLPVPYVSIRQHTPTYVSIRVSSVPLRCLYHERMKMPFVAYAHQLVSIRRYTSAYVSIRQYTSAYDSIRQHTAA
jgi:hypothetical protein